MPEISEDQILEGFAAAESGEPAAPPAATPPSAPQEGTAPQPQSGGQPGAAPWAKDLEGLGLPPEALPLVDKYLRESWQPRMTEFETKTKGYLDLFNGNEEAMQIAAGMIAEFQNDPEKAFRALGAELGYTFDGDEELDGDPGQETLGQPDAQPGALPPEYQQWLDSKMREEQEAQQMKQLEDYFGSVASQHFAGQEFDKDLYHMLFVGAMGNEEAALEMYKKYAAGQQPQAPAQPPPPVLNESTGSAPNAGPKQPQTIDEAMQVFQEMLSKG